MSGEAEDLGTEAIVIDVDPDPTHRRRVLPVYAVLDQIPPRAQSNGWGERPGRG